MQQCGLAGERVGGRPEEREKLVRGHGEKGKIGGMGKTSRQNRGQLFTAFPCEHEKCEMELICGTPMMELP